jgi:hypothetical protein
MSPPSGSMQVIDCLRALAIPSFISFSFVFLNFYLDPILFLSFVL